MKDYFKTVRPGFKTLLVRPDTGARNWHTEDVAKTIADAFKIPLDRFYFEGWRLRYRVQDRVTWEVDFTPDQVEFRMTVPADRVDAWVRRLSGIWEKATITVDVQRPDAWDPDKTVIRELVYRRHDMYSLHVDNRDNLPLPSVLQTVKTLTAGDRAKLFVYFDPVGRLEWQAEFRKAWETLRRGRQPVKRYSDGRALARLGLTVIGQVFQEVFLALADLIKSDTQENRYREKEVDPEAGLPAVEQLAPATKRKGESGALRTFIWALAQSDDPGRREAAARTLAGAFADLGADNELEPREIRNRKAKEAALATVATKEGPRLKFNYSMLSAAEAGKIIQVPGRELQEDFPQVNGVRIQEVTLPDALFGDDGVPLGLVTEKGVTRRARLPLSDHDIECKAEVSYGNMGSGKTGRAIVIAVEGVKNGRTVFLFDMADGQAIDAARDALPEDFPEWKVLDLDFGNKAWPIPLTLTDVAVRRRGLVDNELAALDAAERLTDYLYTFINQLATSEFSDRMEYFLTPVGKGVLSNPRRGLLDVVLALSSPTYRDELLADPQVQAQPEVVDVLRELQRKAVTGSDRVLVQPIIDRLNLLAGKRTLANIFLQPEKMQADGRLLLDFREVMDNEPTGDKTADKYGYFIGLRVPKAELGKEGVNRVASFLLAKIWLATLSRLDTSQGKRRPFYTVIDEPHNCLEGTGPLLDGEVGVESRKYRNKMVFLAHSAEQFGRYRAGIYAGGPFFTFFKTEYQRTFTDHAEKLVPLDARALYEQLPKRWTAAVKMDLPGVDTMPAFICRMQPPPKPVKNRQHIRENCSKKFGRNWKSVVEEIQGKRRILLEDESWRERKAAEADAAKDAARSAKKEARKKKGD